MMAGHFHSYTLRVEHIIHSCQTRVWRQMYTTEGDGMHLLPRQSQAQEPWGLPGLALPFIFFAVLQYIGVNKMLLYHCTMSFRAVSNVTVRKACLYYAVCTMLHDMLHYNGTISQYKTPMVQIQELTMHTAQLQYRNILLMPTVFLLLSG